MSPWETLLVAVALGCDAFAVGLGVGTRFCTPRHIFRLSFHFGFFQFAMPLLGWALGSTLVGVARTWGPWLACAILLFIGSKMAYENLRGEDADDMACSDPTRGMSLVVLSIATSLDALGVGFSFGLLGRRLLGAAVCIGVTAGLMTWAAMRIGSRLSALWGRRMGVVGGVLLMAIALKFIIG
ncbi:Putative Mn2+ efflux pump MntP [Desulfacinum hydrothermale DSM 13146]|uniref:Putative manganese efflux pump MntP n=1 Tax=Desulfacinum hydrothermale DSM 13146 TaxID=1121390 RepID=A0A1W1XUK7_9BACT|nr:manganese efflux pump MntP family protein [Desulfacinum hydrothermale]SMC27586.1 Putative Mn2+ efflux pump MntP [Desulfacinum hydrothermale DSM 13146]